MDAILARCVGRTRALEGVTDALRAKIVEAALGLSSTQAERTFRKAVIASRHGRLDERCIDLITEEKRAVIRESGALEYFPVTETEAEVGGLDELKRWLNQRSQAFGPEAREYRAQYFKDDEPIGQFSDVLQVAVPG